MLKAKNLQIQAVTNVLDDNDLKVDLKVEFNIEESKIESVVSEKFKTLKKMFIHTLKDQIITTYFNNK
jgi:hypothetical protein